MLKDLRIQNYRGFEDFYIDGLARVNLIVGDNNIGKTSFLEAIYLLVNQDEYKRLLEVIYNHDDLIEERNLGMPYQPNIYGIYRIDNLFYGYRLELGKEITIISEKDLSIKIIFRVKNLTKYDLFASEIGELEIFYIKNNNREKPHSLIIQEGGFLQIPDFTSFKNLKNNIFLSNKRLKTEDLASFWAEITLTPKEEKIINSLQIIEPDVERINFTSNPASKVQVIVKIKKYNYPIPLSSMGDGMRQILTLTMAAVNSENGVLLVDEIETGIHYKAQVDMWRLLMETAQELNIQIFATTHSWDCICAFQEALEEREDQSIGKLFRIDNKYGKLRSVEYTPDEIAVAVRQSIEVR
ncbi:conserved hypothetical protein [Gloeothece citriformis PCC 7424]|uniref:ATPase AAA-type core domain-containing protein n=1 Tax=Gloeothece citriformis (strain PCC 7424) TaxID=65393 RepID=B7KCI8_GLOC7|nr:ATP-binding protein [Gloeothece citriformis]ACK70293.1 conserved hypothetical protein [Gloeothece citriformis PCC 7424]